MDPCREDTPQELFQAIEEFNSGAWFECHETLEELWVGSKGEMRDFYQGVLQIAVALHHWRNGNFKGAEGLLERACDMLRRVATPCRGVDVARLVEDAGVMRAALVSLGAERMAEVDAALVPRLHLLSPPPSP